MGGYFGVVSKRDAIEDVFFGTDYHSHLGTRRAGIAAFDEEIGLQREIHNIQNSPFRTKFEHTFDEMKGKGEAERERIMDQTKAGVLDMLKKTVRPEFLNRIDDIIMFSPLNEADIRTIVRLQVEAIVRRLTAQDVTLSVDDTAVSLIARAGFDPEFGARPVKRALQRLLLNDLSRALLSGSVDKTKPIHVKADGEQLTFSN